MTDRRCCCDKKPTKCSNTAKANRLMAGHHSPTGCAMSSFRLTQYNSSTTNGISNPCPSSNAGDSYWLNIHVSKDGESA